MNNIVKYLHDLAAKILSVSCGWSLL